MIMRLKRVAWVSKSKYNNIKVTKIIDWEEVEFDSLIEWKFRDLISTSMKELKIAKIERQKTFELLEWYSWNIVSTKKKKIVNPVGRQKRNYSIEEKVKKVSPITYVCDFILTMEDWTEYIIDVKWFETPDFKLKKKMFESKFWKSLLCINSVLINNWYFIWWLKSKHK